MTKNLYTCFGVHQSFKLHGTHFLGFESCRRALVVLIMASVSILTSLAQTPLNETDVYNRLMERQYMAGYSEGTPWTNDIPYRRDDPYLNHVEFDGWPAGCYGGAGCFGFMMDMMEYASNYEYPIRIINGTYDNLPEIRVGDGIRLDNNGHSVVVLEVHPDGHTVTVAEGNFNSTVHWGRIIDLADPNNGFYYLATFWPEQEPAEPVTITIGESGYATFYYTNSSYVIPEGVEAKVVENISNNILTLIPLSRIIPAGCAVILEGPAGEYTFASTTEEGIAGENMLRGTEDTEWITPEDQTCKYYKLTVKNGKAGFYYGANEGGIFENQAHKAYLPVPQSLSAKCFFFDEATGIDNMMATDENAGRAIYNLAGQVVNDSYKGVVIINGKKVLRK